MVEEAATEPVVFMPCGFDLPGAWRTAARFAGLLRHGVFIHTSHVMAMRGLWGERAENYVLRETAMSTFSSSRGGHNSNPSSSALHLDVKI